MNERSRVAAPVAAPADAGEATRERGESWYGRLLQRLTQRSRDARDELEAALEGEAGEPSLSTQERAMLKAVLGLHRLTAEDVMVPRSDIEAVPADSSLGALLAAFRTAGHSRLPVYGENLDDPQGMIHIRDLTEHVTARLPGLDAEALDAPAVAAGMLRPVLFVPPSMPAMDLLKRMQATRTHIALVIDEHGGTDGLVSMEDLVEMVVGDIEDEHDVAQGLLVAGEGGVIEADARAALDDVSRAAGLDLAALLGPDEEVDTVGGLVVTLAGRVPARGERIEVEGLAFEVVDADPRRVKRVRLLRQGAESSAPAPTLMLPAPSLPSDALPGAEASRA